MEQVPPSPSKEGPEDDQRAEAPHRKDGQLSLLSLEKRKLPGDLTVAFQRLKGTCKQEKG